MIVAVITEGLSEFKSLPALYPQFRARSGNTFLNPLKVNVPPFAAPRIVARECHSRLTIARAHGADLAIIVLDREDQDECAGFIAAEISRASKPLCPGLKVSVVLKDRTFENWLIADLGALRSQPKRFDVSRATVRRVQPNKADGCDGQAILKACVKGDRYEKVRDSQAICSNIDVGAAANHSRSFRHLLHTLGDAAYHAQCRKPAASPDAPEGKGPRRRR